MKRSEFPVEAKCCSNTEFKYELFGEKFQIRVLCEYHSIKDFRCFALLSSMCWRLFTGVLRQPISLVSIVQEVQNRWAVPKRREITNNFCSLISQKSYSLSCIAMEAWNLTLYSVSPPWHRVPTPSSGANGHVLSGNESDDCCHGRKL